MKLIFLIIGILMQQVQPAKEIPKVTEPNGPPMPLIDPFCKGTQHACCSDEQCEYICISV